MVKISPSILSADFSHLASEVKALELAGADMIHIDVMDGQFVPQITIGPVVIKALRAHTSLPFDVHLMINNPENQIEEFVNAGADIITIHYESLINPLSCLKKIKSFNKLAGLSLRPDTSEKVIDQLINEVDLILVMTVNPGAGGQKFMMHELNKINLIAQKINTVNNKIILSVDGGINNITAKYCIEAGADMLVAGSYIFKNPNYSEAIKELKME